jgi:hypothetical protein
MTHMPMNTEICYASKQHKLIESYPVELLAQREIADVVRSEAEARAIAWKGS